MALYIMHLYTHGGKIDPPLNIEMFCFVFKLEHGLSQLRSLILGEIEVSGKINTKFGIQSSFGNLNRGLLRNSLDSQTGYLGSIRGLKIPLNEFSRSIRIMFSEK